MSDKIEISMKQDILLHFAPRELHLLLLYIHGDISASKDRFRGQNCILEAIRLLYHLNFGAI